MYLNQLVPCNNIMEYIPPFLLNDPLSPEMISVVGNYISRDVPMEECIGFLTQLENLHSVIRGEHPDYAGGEGTRATWFSTDKVVDVRLFFRKFNKSHREGTMGSKMRLYSVGRVEEDDDIQGIDSGFITYNSFPTAEHRFQSALAKTMLVHSLYSIGGRATVRKINEVNDGKSVSRMKQREYKWLSALNPLKSDNTNWEEYTHILHPAAIAAGINSPEEYFDGFSGKGKLVLDSMLRLFMHSGSLDEFCDGMLKIRPLGLTGGDIDDIVNHSNSHDANFNDAKDFREGKAEGINVVGLMENIYEIYPD